MGVRSKQMLGELGILTAKFVLPIWQEALSLNTIPQQLLLLAGQVLRGELTYEVVIRSSVVDELYHLIGGSLEGFPANVEFAGEATYNSFISIEHFPFTLIDVTESLTDEQFHSQLGGDAATAAVKAYAGITKNNIWTEKNDPQKQGEFWKWWLEEAIPQAYQLAKL
jgi:hypothetical protein